MDRLRLIIENIVRECLMESGRFVHGMYPHNSRSHRERNVANPIISHGNGSHSNQDVVSQVSTFDDNGSNFRSGKEHYCISDRDFIKYKMQNFGNARLKSTMDFFGGNEVELRREIDRLNGAAKRNDRGLMWRTITCESKSALSNRTDHMLYTFWEFSFNGGDNWYIMKPNAVDNMKESVFVP